MKFKVLLNQQEKTIEVIRQGDQLRISYDGRTYDAHLVHRADAYFVLEVEEPDQDGFVRRRRIRAAGYTEGDKRQLWANGGLVTYRRLREGTVAGPELEAASLSATIPAVVSEIIVKLGDKVKVGDKLVLLESMKMILPIQAPYDGTVTAIKCAAGDSVQPGVQLIELKRGN